MHFDPLVNFGPQRGESAPPEPGDPEERGDIVLSDEVSSLNGGHLTWQPTLESALYAFPTPVRATRTTGGGVPFGLQRKLPTNLLCVLGIHLISISLSFSLF